MTTAKPRGFASMTPEDRRRISSMGGRAAHAQGTARQFDSESGREAARKKNEARKAKREGVVNS